MFQDIRFRRLIISLCALFSIASAVIFAYQTYSFFEKTSNPVQLPSQSGVSQPPSDDLLRGLSRDSPPFLVYSFFGMAISALACATLVYGSYRSSRNTSASQSGTQDEASLRRDQLIARLQPEARQIIGILEKNNGELTQSELVGRSGMGKLKVSRIIRRLEAMKLVKKHPYGMTNLVVLDPNLPVEKGA